MEEHKREEGRMKDVQMERGLENEKSSNGERGRRWT